MTIRDELEAIAKEFRADRQEDKQNPESSFQRSSAEGSTGKTSDHNGLKLKRASDIVRKHQGWLVPSFIPDDTLIIVAGQAGVGKTTACLSLAASITNGETPILGGSREPRNVLMLCNEESEAGIREKFERLGGDVSRLYVEDQDSDIPWGLEDIPGLETEIAKLAPALVIIDSLTTHKPNNVDMNSHGDVAPMLVALRKLASKYGCAIICVHHTNKSQTTDALVKISGSIGIIATARHVILVAPHPDDPNMRVAAIAKTNLVEQGAPGYVFNLGPFAWDGATPLRAGELLQQSGDNTRSRNDAEIFLRDALAEGREEFAVLVRLAKDHGINRRTLQRAGDQLGVVSKSGGFGRGRKTYWSLPSVIDDTISDSSPKAVADGPKPMETPLFDAVPPINDTSVKTVADVSPMAAEEMFETEV